MKLDFRLSFKKAMKMWFASSLKVFPHQKMKDKIKTKIDLSYMILSLLSVNELFCFKYTASLLLTLLTVI